MLGLGSVFQPRVELPHCCEFDYYTRGSINRRPSKVFPPALQTSRESNWRPSEQGTPIISTDRTGSLRLRVASEFQKMDAHSRESGPESSAIQGDGVKPQGFLPMVHRPIMEKGVLRFDAHGEAQAAAWPSLSFEDPATREAALAGSSGRPAVVPDWRMDDGQLTVTLELPSGTTFYGTGEVSANLERSGKRIFCWNTDAWGYSPDSTSLYQSHPWVLALLPDGTALGILADTTRRCEVDLRCAPEVRFVAEGWYPVVTFGPYSHPADVVAALGRATGTAPFPPRWALGFHQCRFSYEPDTRVRQVADTFRDLGIPCDVIWMDIDYMDRFRCFTFDPVKFPDPADLSAYLHSRGFKGVWMLDPGIKAEAGYFAHDSGSHQDVWVQGPAGEPYEGRVWPGECTFPDYTTERARTWWASLVVDFVRKASVDGIWNDMNEPAIFGVVTKTMPKNNVHRGDEALGGRQPHTHYHNVYGMLMARSTFEGMRLAAPEKRPFVLTRAGFLGSQRYAATWTGDNLATWQHLHFSIPMALNLSLSGQPLCGPDIGGFAGDATPRLFARWMGIGALLPFSRAHSEAGTKHHEPWSFGKECEACCRAALLRRYRLLPHLYTLFRSAAAEGAPVMTPLFFADPQDPRLRSVEDAFLLGPLLVAASTRKEEGASPDKVVLPKGVWRRFHFDDPHPDLPLLYLAGGAMVPCGPPHQSTMDVRRTDELTLLVALDEAGGGAEGTLYEDAGDGYGHEDGEFLLTRYRASLAAATSTSERCVRVEVAGTEGRWERPRRPLRVRLLVGDCAEVLAEGWDGEALEVPLPSAAVLAQLRAASAAAERDKLDAITPLADLEEAEEQARAKSNRKMIEMNAGDWLLKVVPWIGGRILSMVHAPTGQEWLEGRLESGCYEEYSGREYRSAGCTESYQITFLDLAAEASREADAAVELEGSVGGGLAMRRRVSVRAGEPEVLHIASAIVAKAVGAGSGGFSRPVILRVHPTFHVVHPDDVRVVFTALSGERTELHPESASVALTGDQRPAGMWALEDLAAKVSLVNEFSVEEVEQCLVHWEGGSCNLELWSHERPVSVESPLAVAHNYRVQKLT